jgi:hypothetical protein
MTEKSEMALKKPFLLKSVAKQQIKTKIITIVA